MKHRLALSLVAFAALALGCRLEWKTAARLHHELEAARRDNRQLALLRAEHERLAQAQLSTATRDALLREATETSRLKKLAAAHTDLAPQQAIADPIPSSPLEFSGTWVNASEWMNCGRPTPETALATIFWAAANGDVGVVRDSLELAPKARAMLQATLAMLGRHHTAVPAAYGSPEELMALFTVRDALAERVKFAVGAGLDSDHAVATIMLQTADGGTREATLSLHRSDGEWRLVVPFAAAEKIVDELSGPEVPHL
jgi:hypothetical protein